MSLSRYCFVLTIAVSLVIISEADSLTEIGLESTTCSLLSSKLVASNPWTSYPLVYEPTQRGRLTVWTGISSLPTKFANFANKLEWTFYDMSKDITHHGVTVNHCDDVKFKVVLNDAQQSSYLECNSVSEIERIPNSSDYTPDLQTYCADCSHSLLALINNQIRQLLKLTLDDQIKENLFWDISQLITNQHFSGPVPL